MGTKEHIPEEVHDLTLAVELQAALLPSDCLTECPHHVTAARNRMCGSVGGDFYDFIQINDEQVALLIGDVVGHGVQASLVMAQIMGYLRSHPESLSRPIEIIGRLNHTLIELGARTETVLPCSIFYAVLDTPTGISMFVNCGHPRPFLGNKEGSSSLPLGPQNLLMGIKELDLVEGCHTLTTGERLTLYTDGLIDTTNLDNEHFGTTRLNEIINACAKDSPSRCTDTVFEAISQFRGDAEQTDDETIVVIDRI